MTTTIDTDVITTITAKIAETLNWEISKVGEHFFVTPTQIECSKCLMGLTQSYGEHMSWDEAKATWVRRHTESGACPFQIGG